MVTTLYRANNDVQCDLNHFQFSTIPEASGSNDGHKPRSSHKQEGAEAYGKLRYKIWLRVWQFLCESAIFRREPASGTKSSIVCSVTLRRTGEDGLWLVMK